MKKQQTKKGKIERIEEDKITIFNVDGGCRDILPITPLEAQYSMEEFGVGEKVIYVIEDGRLVQMEQERSAPELDDLYDVMPKDVRCVRAA